MKRSSGPRKTANLPKSVLHQLSMYTVAAGAAGVGLALIPSAEATIVYTRTHTAIQFRHPLNVDIDGDGRNDIQFEYSSPSSHQVGLWVDVLNRKNQIWGNGIDASALPAGARIASDAHFRARDSVMFVDYRGLYYGSWRNVKCRYLGIKFAIRGKIHYGWARLNVDFFGGKIILTGYAYETIPNKAIIAGKTKGPDEISTQEPDATLTMPTPDPATLGALAMGSPGLSIWRRKESVGATVSSS